jgi:hypothetical protein
MTRCRFCKSDIPSDARRCPQCRSFLIGEQPQRSKGHAAYVVDNESANIDRKSRDDISNTGDDEKPQGSSEQVTYIVDKGLVTFAKFAAATLAIFFTIGIFFYGLDIKQLSKQIQETHVQSQKLDLDIKRAQLDLEGATADIKKDVESAKADIKKDIESAEASAKEASDTASKAQGLLLEAEQSKQRIQQYEGTLLPLPQGSKQVPAPQASQPAPDPGQLERLIDARLLETLKNVLVPEQYSALRSRIGAEKRAACGDKCLMQKTPVTCPAI